MRDMREIFIKYNPYKVETTVTIDGKPVKKSSMLNMDDRRLQEWIDELPESWRNAIQRASILPSRGRYWITRTFSP